MGRQIHRRMVMIQVKGDEIGYSRLRRCLRCSSRIGIDANALVDSLNTGGIPTAIAASAQMRECLLQTCHGKKVEVRFPQVKVSAAGWIGRMRCAAHVQTPVVECRGDSCGKCEDDRWWQPERRDDELTMMDGATKSAKESMEALSQSRKGPK